MAWFGTKFEQNCWRIEPGLSAYSSQQQEKAERQQKTSRVQFCSNLVPNHFTGLLVAPRSLADSVHSKLTSDLSPNLCIFTQRSYMSNHLNPSPRWQLSRPPQHQVPSSKERDTAKWRWRVAPAYRSHHWSNVSSLDDIPPFSSVKNSICTEFRRQ